MPKLSLNKAAKEACVAKSTLLEALKTGRLSGSKNEKGHWDIDTSELFRVFPKTGSENSIEPIPTGGVVPVRTVNSDALEVEVQMLREQVTRLDAERERERLQLTDQIDVLKSQFERQSSDHRQALAILTDQRHKESEAPKRGLWAKILGR